MEIEKMKSYYCAIEATMAIIGGKYKVLIIHELIGKTLRYSELQRLLPIATPRMLSRQLKELGDYFRCAYRSLAVSYRQALDELEANTGVHYDKLYIVGGGAKNKFLNNLTQEATGK